MNKHLWIMLLILSGCNAYSSKFNCPDAKGAPCLMMSDVEMMVRTGEIENYHYTRGQLKKKYKHFPAQRNKQLLKAKIEEQVEEPIEFEEKGFLYVK